MSTTTTQTAASAASNGNGNNIKVVCRFRPMNRMETDAQSEECIEVDQSLTTVRMKSRLTSGGSGSDAALPGPEKDGFTFDRVFPSDSRQVEIFDFGVKGIVEDVMAGFNGTLFCYGQTGSGKTFTMMGSDIENAQMKGLIPRITEQIFASIARADGNVEYTVKVSYMEIYMERIRDLLAPANDNLSIHEDKTRGVYVKGLTDVYVGSETEVYAVMKAGGKARAISATNMNAESSRSHSIFVVGIHQKNVETGSQKSGNLYLVDLAGSEKVGKTGASGQTLEEAKKINKSLSALGMVINNLTDGKSTHVPYRDSKLTRILQESLGGNSRTTLIINCSPASFNEAETLSTLRFGMRAKSIKNKARVNTEMSPAELRIVLSKIKGELVFVDTYKDALLGEVGVWRTGKKVEEPDWATEEKVRMIMLAGNGSSGGLTAGAGRDVQSQRRPPSSLLSPTLTSASGTPSRSASPSVFGTGRDTPSIPRLELDEFLRRQVDPKSKADAVTDQLASISQESSLSEKEQENAALKLQFTDLQQRWDQVAQDRVAADIELKELRSGHSRLEDEARRTMAELETARDRELQLSAELEAAKRHITELEKSQATAAADDREKRKADMLAEMIAKIDANAGDSWTSSSSKLRRFLEDLDASSTAEIDYEGGKAIIRQHLTDNQVLLKSMQERLRQSEEHLQVYEQKHGDLENLLAQRNTSYEELLARNATGVVGDEAVAEIKASFNAQYDSKRGLLEVETSALRRRLESKDEEAARLQDTIDSQAASIEDLNFDLGVLANPSQRILADANAGVQNGQELVKMTQELERTRRAAEIEHAEFEVMKRNLVRDLMGAVVKLQVVELQIALDEYKEKYRAIARATNAQAHTKKLQVLEYNMGQLHEVQRGLVNQNTNLKRDLNTAERKLAERKERIINLERLVEQSEAQLKLREADLVRAHRDLHTANMYGEMAKENHLAQGLGFSRIAKPLRGGGAANAPSNTSFNYSGAGGLPTNTTNRLSDEGNTGTAKRQSWFFSSSR
ncbi:hypothetical protein QFC21_006412 [Naganishia friedmannii]|uniref:Uncharacterized protein n=1 Tax=Naganishia friedmannii TaxID=89922 RepID=A0ACC2V2B8_9TREE|nr:hypothetical protein QFC21_006412 [Naganishia friedmannii]